jgi:hypothetical protein
MMSGEVHPASLLLVNTPSVKIIAIIVACFVLGSACAQEVTQTVRGKITNEEAGLPLAGAVVVFAPGAITVSTDNKGNFSATLPIGRYKMTVGHEGHLAVSREVLVIAGKETVINATLEQSARQLQEVEITGTVIPEDVPGMRSLTIEKTLRVPANFMDPVRVATAYPGVIATSDQNNSIIVRGNSPNGLLWRLNGLNIVNPNHLANAGTLSDRPASNGGGVNILSAQMLDRTDFYMGSFPASYGNALSGIVDMKLRDGNKSKAEYTAQASLIGLDIAAEGPLGKREKTSFLANYRYSTVGLLSAAGVNFGDEAISFQDLSFNLNTLTTTGGSLSFFGFYGSNRNEFEAKEPEEWEEDKDKYDILYASKTGALGLSYSAPVFGGKLFSGMAYSAGDQDREANVSMAFPWDERVLLSDGFLLKNAIGSANLRFQKPFGERTGFEVGVTADYISNDYASVKNIGCIQCSSRTTIEQDADYDGVLIQPFANVNFVLSPTVTFDAGLRYSQFSYNNTNAVEPRAKLAFQISPLSKVDLAYSLVSQIQSQQVYAGAGNEDLGLSKSHHFDLQYRQSLDRDLSFTGGLFYQQLFDIPVEADVSSTFSAINLIEDVVPDNLVSEGVGENVGADLTLEKLFFANHYLMLGASYYESTYKGRDQVKRDTRFNGNYTFSGVYGKEWNKSAKGRTISLSTRLLYLGGLRQSAIDVAASQASYETVYDTTEPYNEQLNDYFRIDVRLGFSKNKPGYTRTFAIDIQNLSGQQNEAYRYFDFTQQKVVTKFQLGIIPVLLYRIDF